MARSEEEFENYQVRIVIEYTFLGLGQKPPDKKPPNNDEK